jgi:hypothetical protein
MGPECRPSNARLGASACDSDEGAVQGAPTPFYGHAAGAPRIADEYIERVNDRKRLILDFKRETHPSRLNRWQRCTCRPGICALVNTAHA